MTARQWACSVPRQASQGRLPASRMYTPCKASTPGVRRQPVRRAAHIYSALAWCRLRRWPCVPAICTGVRAGEHGRSGSAPGSLAWARMEGQGWRCCVGCIAVCMCAWAWENMTLGTARRLRKAGKGGGWRHVLLVQCKGVVASRLRVVVLGKAQGGRDAFVWGHEHTRIRRVGSQVLCHSCWVFPAAPGAHHHKRTSGWQQL